MCPCISSKSKFATCGRSEDGLMVPSVFERENYCFGLYELCPFFLSFSSRACFGMEDEKEFVFQED
jgi:hypothetical protein